jgi:hypothetical protein
MTSNPYELEIYEISSLSSYGGGSRAAYSMGYESTGYDALSGYSMLDGEEVFEQQQQQRTTSIAMHSTTPTTTTSPSSSSTTSTATPITTTVSTNQAPMSVVDTIRVRTTTNFRGNANEILFLCAVWSLAPSEQIQTGTASFKTIWTRLSQFRRARRRHRSTIPARCSTSK